MISFQAALSPDQRSKMTIPDAPRKRKWGDGVEEEVGERFVSAEFSRQKRHGSGKPGSSALDMELRLEEPLLAEWQRRADIQSGEVRFYDEGTCKECEIIVTASHPPMTATPTIRRAVSLNLELNLQPYDEYLPPQEAEGISAPSAQGSPDKGEQRTDGQEGQEGEGDEEMVATVCGRCHMLVMLCVSRPCCPNCKFLHPKPDQTPFTLLLRPPPPKCTATAAQLLC